MTKSSKLIATLGVVAGLGVAALPLGSVFAAQNTAEVSGNVDLYVEVQPAIAMQIVGNNDDNVTDTDNDGGYGEAGTNAKVEVKNPTGATTIAGKDVSSFEDNTATKASSSYMSILPNATGSMTSTVTVWTNNTTGFTLKVNDQDTNTALTGTSPMTDTIPANATTTAGTAAWSIASDGGLNASAIVASDATNPLTAKTTSARTASASGDVTTMTYAVSTAANQQTGVYTDTIVYTATTN